LKQTDCKTDGKTFSKTNINEERHMAPIPKGGTVAVTGSAGFIGGWVVRGLLDKGYRVRACVRDVDDQNKVGFLKAMPGFVSGRLTLHAADLDQAGCFDEIFKGCHGVAHLSHVSTYDDMDYVKTVCDHVIKSVNEAQTVTRVVVTSSIAAVISEQDMQELVRRPVLYEGRYPDEQNPRRLPERGQGYSMGKVLAERAFSDAAAEHGGWDAITCCPADNVGPILSAHQKNFGPWQHNIETMLLGEYSQNVIGAYRPWFTVDVRDVAEAHIRMLENLDVENGQRLIAWSTETRNVEEVCASIDRLLPELGFAGATLIDPFPEKVRAKEAEFRAIWGGCELRNDRIRAVLGMTFRPLDDSIRDCVESLLSVGGVVPRRKSEVSETI
jgi:nucleoside-diphosphate-sugar epimerase